MTDNPLTRKELYLAAIDGHDVEIPQPLTREDAYLYNIAMNLKSGGGGVAVDSYTKIQTDELLNKKADKGVTEENISALTSQLNFAIGEIDSINESQKVQIGEIENLKDQINYVVSQSALNKSAVGLQKKNLLSFPGSVTKGGITFTFDKNGYMSGNKTSDDDRLWNVDNSQYRITLKPGIYILSFVSSVICTNNYGNIMILDVDGSQIANIGQKNYAKKESGEINFTIESEKTIYIMAKIFDGITAIMIRHAEITDDTYEPYVDDLQTQIDELKAQIEQLKEFYATILPAKEKIVATIEPTVTESKSDFL